MKRIKSCILVIFLLSCTCISVGAATIVKRGTISSNYLLTYPYSYSYETKIWYNSPGDGLIYNANDLTLSNQVCNAACFIDANQTSKNITSSGGGVKYGVTVNVYVKLDAAAMYVGSKTDYITLSSPGPRSIDESDILGEEYFFDSTKKDIYFR